MSDWPPPLVRKESLKPGEAFALATIYWTPIGALRRKMYENVVKKHMKSMSKRVQKLIIESLNETQEEYDLWHKRRYGVKPKRKS